jgi:hypothetical protein
VRQFISGALILQREGVYHERPDDTGARSVVLYPTPTGELAVELEYVYNPSPLTSDSAEPTEIPRPFHEAFLPAAAAVYYETVEDNPELAQRNAEQVDLWVGKLARYDNQRRGGAEPFLVPIAGVTA